MSIHIPTVRATSTPSVQALGDAAVQWAIVTAGLRSFLARVVGDGYGDALTELADVFDYAERRELVTDPARPDQPRVAMQRQLFPASHFGGASIFVRVDSILWLHSLAPRELESLRSILIQAWEGREHLRRASGRVELVDPSTQIAPLEK